MTMATTVRRDAGAAPVLSDLEWKVVSLALRDAGDACARSGGGVLGRIWSALTGLEPKRPLADPRLETLRRFVCTARRRRDEATALAGRLLDMGFSQPQIAAVALLARR